RLMPIRSRRTTTVSKQASGPAVFQSKRFPRRWRRPFADWCIKEKGLPTPRDASGHASQVRHRLANRVLVVHKENLMLRSTRLQMVAVLAAGALLGYAAASGSLNPFPRAGASPQPAEPGGSADAGCCAEGVSKGQLVALAAHNQNVQAKAAQAGKKPNIL